MRNIYLVQPDVIRTRKHFKTAYLPYATGQLWAYARQDERIAKEYQVKKFIFLFEKIEALVDKMENPFLVGFSAYVWNTEYCKALAKAVKEKFPQCKILFGGHNVPPDDAFLKQFSYIDYLINGEGEIPIRRLLLELLTEDPNYAVVPGLHYRLPDGTFAQNPPEALLNLEEVPSPYLTGVFNEILAQHTDIQWSTVFETNRGCPYRCAYCDWGVQISKIRCFSVDRILDEIVWFGANRIDYVLFADANYGIFERDEMFVDTLIAQFNAIGYPSKTEIIYAKDSPERVMRIVKKLFDAKLGNSGATISLQSVSPTVLKNINRSNFDFSHYKNIFQVYRQAHLPAYSELILGLPGETFQSFCQGIGKLIDMGQHEGILVYQLALLPNSSLARPDVQRKFSLQTKRCLCRMGSRSLAADDFEDVPEYIDYVFSTDSMSQEDMLSAYLFSNLVLSVHSFALVWYLAIFLHDTKQLPYEDLYCDLLDFVRNNPGTLLFEALETIKKKRLNSQEGGVPVILALPYDKNETTHEPSWLFGIYSYELERFFQEIAPFFSRYFDDEMLLDELLRYQFESIRQPNAPEKVCSFHYDFPAYFKDSLTGDPRPLQKREVQILFQDAQNPTDWESYGFEVVFLGARENRSLYTISYVESPDHMEGK